MDGDMFVFQSILPDVFVHTNGLFPRFNTCRIKACVPSTVFTSYDTV